MKCTAENPIGLFDSGMGGLTVAKTISEVLPNEDLIYFGDTAHTPWGDKSTKTIETHSLRICDVLLEHHCKLIVVACHTASTTVFDAVKAHIGNQAHVLNVVDPIIHHIEHNHANKKIGLIGTKQTIRSNAYKKYIGSLNKNIEFAALATPLLVPLIEEGFIDKESAKMIIQEYLAHPTLTDIQALVLGCTHYPLIKKHIQHYYQNPIDIIDASDITAIVLKNYLIQHQLLNPQHSSKRTFYASDCNEFFIKTAKMFFPGEIQIEPYGL